MNRPLTKHLEEAQGTKQDWDLAEKLMTQQDIINENIIKQYEIRVQQDSERIHALNGELAKTRCERDCWKDERDEKVKLLVSERIHSGQVEAEIDKFKEWLAEYRNQLKKENVFHKNQGIINAINELLSEKVCEHCNGSGYEPYPNHDTTMRPCPKCSGV